MCAVSQALVLKELREAAEAAKAEAERKAMEGAARQKAEAKLRLKMHLVTKERCEVDRF